MPWIATAGRRDDLFKKEEAEMGVLRGYLPQASPVNLRRRQTGFRGRRNQSRANQSGDEAGVAKPAGRADGKAINAIAMKLLQ